MMSGFEVWGEDKTITVVHRDKRVIFSEIFVPQIQPATMARF
jgi:hypothetical protein